MTELTSRCRHCGEPIIRVGHQRVGPWAHPIGSIGGGSILYRCDTRKSKQPYGLEAEPEDT